MRFLGIGFRLNKKHIHGFATAHSIHGMELDFDDIHLLSPPGLWPLAPIRALIGVLLVVLRFGSGQYRALYLHMLARQGAYLREKIAENLNMRIKAWVLLCPARTAWVRGIIGEMAITRWRKNRLADYALTKYFGDWQRKWPEGFKNREQQNSQNSQKRKPVFGHTARTYIWKPFALVRIMNVSRLLYGRPATNTGTTNSPNWTQPRGTRTLKPVRFTPEELEPEELEPEAMAGHAENGADKVEHLPAQDALSDAQVNTGTAFHLPHNTEPP